MISCCADAGRTKTDRASETRVTGVGGEGEEEGRARETKQSNGDVHSRSVSCCAGRFGVTARYNTVGSRETTKTVRSPHTCGSRNHVTISCEYDVRIRRACDDVATPATATGKSVAFELDLRFLFFPRPRNDPKGDQEVV